MANEILEARIKQAEDHQEDTSANLGALIQQNEENNPNPNLEAMIEQNEENTEKVVKKLDEMKPKKNANIENMANFISGFFEQMVGADGEDGDKGDKGDQGEKGDKGERGMQGIKGDKGERGDQGERGEKGDAGADGRDGIDGRDGRDGKDGKDADIKQILEMVVDKIKKLEGEDRISYNDLKDTPQMYKDGMVGQGISNTTITNDLGLNFVDDETPEGTLNGSNKVFTTAQVPVSGSLKLYRNGQRLRITEDYTLSANEITLIVAPESDEVLLCDYRF